MNKTGKKYLIINLDDYGLCLSSNKAVEEILDGGTIRSASIMPVCPFSENTFAYASGKQGVTFGIHLVNTSEWENCRWTPLTGGKSLADESGYMWRDSAGFAKAVKRADLLKETEAQIALTENSGVKLTHFDTHMGALYGCFGKPHLLLTAFGICRRHSFAFRIITKYLPSQCPDFMSKPLFRVCTLGAKILSLLTGVRTPDYMINPEIISSDGSYESFRESMLDYISSIPEGVSEIYMHPALPGEDIKSICPGWKRRYYDYLFLKDGYVYDELEKRGIIIADYSILK